MNRGSGRFLVYGAAGLTGRQIAMGASARGLRPVLAGREGRAIAALARRLECPYRIFELEDRRSLEAALGEVELVLHAAGPFAETWRPMVTACLRTGTHYADINGEVEVTEALARLDGRARKRGILLLPALGWDAVPFDGLAAELAARGGPPIRALRFLTCFRPWVWLGRGSARTWLAAGPDRPRVRSGGELVALRGAPSMPLRLGDRRYRASPISLAALSTVFRTTGVAEIEAFCDPGVGAVAADFWRRWSSEHRRRGPWGLLMSHSFAGLPEGPPRAFRSVARTLVIAEAEYVDGSRARAALETREAYAVTASIALDVLARVLGSTGASGDDGAMGVRDASGFRTPCELFGAAGVLACEGIERGDVR